MSTPKWRQEPYRTGRRRWIVLAGSGAVLALALTLALAPLFHRSSSPPSAPEAQSIVISMGGFAPDHLVIPAGRPTTLVIINPDSKFHTDGGGWHQFAIDPLHLDTRIPPRSQQVVRLDPLPAGTYEFYCDICCGGRVNPSMRGILEVTG